MTKRKVAVISEVARVTPDLNDYLTDLLADQGIEVLTGDETEFISAWKQKHHPRRKYLTEAQMDEARAEYTRTKVTSDG